jgi:hypothetical protein
MILQMKEGNGCPGNLKQLLDCSRHGGSLSWWHRPCCGSCAAAGMCASMQQGYAVKRHRYSAGPPCRDKGATDTFTMPLSCDGENNEQSVTVTVPGRGALPQASGGARSQFESADSGGQYGSFERPPQRIATWQMARPAPYLCPELPDR